MADKTKRIGELKVRTITERRDCRDRTTVKHLQRINLDRAAMKIETAAALPKQAQAVFEENRVLLKKAKGLAVSPQPRARSTRHASAGTAYQPRPPSRAG